MRASGGKAICILVMLALGACSSDSGMPNNSRSAADLNAQLGLAYMERGNDELAMKKLQHALELDSNSADAHHYIAQLYMKLGNNSEAEVHYRKALSIAPTDPMLLNNYGVFLCRQRRMDEAREKFLEAVKQPFYRTPEEAYNNAGVCSLEVADTGKAEEFFRDALRVNPNMPEALYEMANLKFKQHQYLPARAFLQRYMDVAPVSPEILWLGMKVEHNLGDETSAANYARRLQQNFPASQEAELLREQAGP